jgi:hypothetical protein
MEVLKQKISNRPTKENIYDCNMCAVLNKGEK